MNQERNRIVADVVKNLEQVFDPEMPSVSVIHLGLIYDIEVLEENTVVKITHTLTSAFDNFKKTVHFLPSMLFISYMLHYFYV